MILQKILITKCMYPKFHRFGIRRVLGSNLAEPGEPRPRPMPTPTTTPLSGWVLTFAVSAKPSALPFALRGEHPLGTCFRLWACRHKPKGCACKTPVGKPAPRRCLPLVWSKSGILHYVFV